MPNPPPRPHKPRPESYPLRVFRIEPGQSWTALMLSLKVGGLFTHWLRGRSVYCDPRDCPPAKHQASRAWKGYVAAHLWDAPAALWLPIVLEVTEALELDFRGVYAAGQLWELSRPEQSDKRKTPVCGRLLGARPAHQVPEAFPVVDVLRHMYHVEAIDLTQRNPLPDRTIVSPVQAPPPAELGTDGGAEVATAEDLRRFGREIRSVVPGLNGHSEPK